MGNKWASVDFALCHPSECDQECGLCQAATVCTHKLLLQEEPYEEPMLISAKMCVGCGDCVKACPLGAIEILRGY
jgi:ATP-binding cassette subfamily E protein 1